MIAIITDDLTFPAGTGSNNLYDGGLSKRLMRISLEAPKAEYVLVLRISRCCKYVIYWRHMALSAL